MAMMVCKRVVRYNMLSNQYGKDASLEEAFEVSRRGYCTAGVGAPHVGIDTIT